MSVVEAEAGVIGRLIEIVALECDIDMQTIGSTTITGESVAKGFQADEAYYVANEARVRGKSVHEPDIDPPPDSVIEVDVTDSSLRRMPSFAAIGIPEVRRHNGDEVRFHRLSDYGEYEEISSSVAFPFVTSGAVTAISSDWLTSERMRSFVNSSRK